MIVSKAELLRMMKPVLDRLEKACIGVSSPVAMYSLMTTAMVNWRRTKLPLQHVHKFIDQLAKAEPPDRAN